ncbi:uncharacterized protein Dmul_11430 [Desulfococcus multivorans]|nr:uncharacterized protein Dmul_11430 [Desulfococcus multivorans]
MMMTGKRCREEMTRAVASGKRVKGYFCKQDAIPLQSQTPALSGKDESRVEFVFMISDYISALKRSWT